MLASLSTMGCNSSSSRTTCGRRCRLIEVASCSKPSNISQLRCYLVWKPHPACHLLGVAAVADHHQHQWRLNAQLEQHAQQQEHHGSMEDDPLVSETLTFHHQHLTQAPDVPFSGPAPEAQHSDMLLQPAEASQLDPGAAITDQPTNSPLQQFDDAVAAPAPAALPGEETAAIHTHAPESSDDSRDQTPSNKQSFTFFYTHVAQQISEPAPVQMPPPEASQEPVKPYFNYARYKPPNFLRHYPAAPDGSYNLLSFLGGSDPSRGKFMAAGAKLDQFLTSFYHTMVCVSRRMYIAESYQGQPFKYFQELDFPWELDPQLVLQLVPRVVSIVTQEVSRVYADQVPTHGLSKPLLSMRTIYKVHLNFPCITTMEPKACIVRKAVINRCRTELSGLPPLDKLKQELQLQEHWQDAQRVLLQLQADAAELQKLGQEIPLRAQQLLQQHQGLIQSALENSHHSHTSENNPLLQKHEQQQHHQQEQPQQLADQALLQQQCRQLDWESIIDFPHGSLRLLGSCKAPWMDSDPVWVTEKSYGRVECVDGVWWRQPLQLGDIMQCSILLQEGELRVFEQTDEFLEVTYQTVQVHQQELAAKSAKRSAKKALAQVQKQLQQPLPETGPGSAAAVAAEEEQQKQDLASQRTLMKLQAAEEAQQQQQLEKKKAAALAALQAMSSSSQRGQSVLVKPLQRVVSAAQPPSEQEGT